MAGMMATVGAGIGRGRGGNHGKCGEDGCKDRGFHGIVDFGIRTLRRHHFRNIQKSIRMRLGPSE
jgi:hypothetical protein